MKTPDEIKKGIRICFSDDEGCDQCPYFELGSGCFDCLKQDALVCIQQFETRLAQAEKEKQALIYDLLHIAPDELCEACSHSHEESKCEENDFDCDKCPEDCVCKACHEGFENFLWRGLCPENTKEAPPCS